MYFIYLLLDMDKLYKRYNIIVNKSWLYSKI